MIRNFFNTSRKSLALAIGWTFILITMIMRIIAGDKPSWFTGICAIICCIAGNFSEYLRRKDYD